MMLKKFRCLALVMILILVFVSCATFAAAKPIKLVYGHVYIVSHYYTEIDRHFKKLVEKKSKGQIVVNIFPGSQLGSEQEMFDATISGAQQMMQLGFGSYIVKLWPKLATFDLPYLIRDYKHSEKIAKRFDSLLDPDEFVAKTGLRVLFFKSSEPRHLTTKFPVNKLEDIKGLKMRVPNGVTLQELWKVFGTAPLYIPSSDLYTSLATGVVDAQESPLANIYAKKFFEQQKYCALTTHCLNLYPVLINNNCWKSLTGKQKKILTDAGVKCTKMSFKLSPKKEKEYYQLLVKAGMKFTKPNLVLFRKEAKKVWSKYGDEKLIKKINAIK
jgi:tripartite ATP-independent transporter DctP family solute receptor